MTEIFVSAVATPARSFDEIIDDLNRSGMTIQNVARAIGIITGSIEDAALIAHLEKVTGVTSVRPRVAGTAQSKR